MFCQFKNLFGEPRKGVHSIRLFDFAVFDIVMTIFVAWMIAYFMKYNFFIVLTLLFILGEFLHILFCTNTKFIQSLSLSSK